MPRKTKKIKYAISRRQKRLLIVLIVGLILPAVVTLDRIEGLRVRTHITEQIELGPDGRKYHSRTFTVINIVDGDTLDIDIPDAKYPHTRIRLLGMDTPETGGGRYPEMHFGKEATKRAEELALNKDVTVLIDPAANVRDKYNRLLAYVQLPDGTILNETLVKEGFAYADLRFPHTNYQKYIELQDDAMTNTRGLWKDITRDQLPQWLQRESPNLLKH